MTARKFSHTFCVNKWEAYDYCMNYLNIACLEDASEKTGLE